ncbi:MAG: 1,4-dihydroxy-2-naphthoate octaprenyltransferase [Bdellovibrionaceae bacterium]|nr:1,4-dihydroxy-2-naphthoate octaprenyltransferase [Pseudobdellovibrionaceae bacterium]
MNPYLLSLRPKTLVAAAVPVLSAAVLVFAEQDSVPWFLVVSVFLCALCIQVATNLFNDLIDFKKGADTHQRIGPVRVTQSGLMSERQVLFVALFFSLLAVGFGVPLVLKGGWVFLLLGIAALFLAYGYTGGPFPLAYLGIGDVFVILFFGLVAVMGSYYLFTGNVSQASLVMGVQLGCLSTVLLAINNLRDSVTDKVVGKKTLAVRFGDRFVQVEIFFLIFLAYALTFYWWVTYQKSVFAVVFLSLPLAVFILRGVFFAKEKQALNKMLGFSGLFLLIFASLNWIAFLL